MVFVIFSYFSGICATPAICKKYQPSKRNNVDCWWSSNMKGTKCRGNALLFIFIFRFSWKFYTAFDNLKRYCYHVLVIWQLSVYFLASIFKNKRILLETGRFLPLPLSQKLNIYNLLKTKKLRVWKCLYGGKILDV